MEHIFRRKWFENTTFCIAVVKLACTEVSRLVAIKNIRTQLAFPALSYLLSESEFMLL